MQNSKPSSKGTRSPRRQRPRRRRNNRPLRVSFADRLAPLMPQLASSEPTPRPRPLPAPPPKSARDVLGVLLAATGLVLAASRNARVELLPGLPVTVVISNGRDPAAAFVLPISQAEARKVFGKPMKAARDPIAELLYEEGRQTDASSLDDMLDQRRAWSPEDRHAS